MIPQYLHMFTCAYCTGDGIDRPDFVDREDFEAHMAHLHYGLPFEFQPSTTGDGPITDLVRRHTHDGQNVLIYNLRNPEDGCRLCRALVTAGVLSIDEIGADTAARLSGGY